MRITGGTLVNRRIECPKGIIRPAMDRMRESLFSILGNLDGVSFLDLFSGSGTVGLEAFSRGASPVYLIEKDRKKIPVIKKNIAGCEEHVFIKALPAEVFVQRPNRSFDIVYCDPPFPYRFKKDLLEALSKSRVVTAGGLVLIHRPREDEMPESLNTLRRIDQREYGRSILDFYRKEL